MFNDLLIKEYSKKNEFDLKKFSRGSKQKVWWECRKCKHEWETRIAHRTNGSGCPKCGTKKMHKTKAENCQSIKITDPEIAQEWHDKYDINLVSRGSNRKYLWMCEKCNKTYRSSVNCRCLLKQSCPYCAGRYPTEINNLLVSRPDLAKEILEIDPLQICPNSNKKVKWKCSVCLHEWQSTVNNRFRGRGCPECCAKNSKPQKFIESILKENNINYVKEFRIKDCKNKRPLPFDFAIFNNNGLYCLIEYQGEQHFYPIWGEKSFEQILHNDKIKQDFCDEKSIMFLKINYWEQANIPLLLNAFRR